MYRPFFKYSNIKQLKSDSIHIWVEFLIPCLPLSVRVDWYKLLDPDLYAVGKVKVVESFIGFVSHTSHSKFPQLPLESKSRHEKRWSAGELMQCWVEEVSFSHFSANSQFTSLIVIFARTKIAQMKNSRVSALVILRTFLEEIWTVARIQMWPSPPHGKLRPGPLNGGLKCKPARQSLP